MIRPGETASLSRVKTDRSKEVESDPDSPLVTMDGSVVGTPSYMPPEQASGKLDAVTETADVYSLGAVLYALLTGRPPFEDSNPMKVLIAHVRDQVLPPSKVNPDIPRDLEKVVIRCLAKEPHERFQDVESLEQALSQCHGAEEWTQANAAEWWKAVDPPNPPIEILGEDFAPTPSRA